MDLLQKKFREGMLVRFSLGAWGICGGQQTPQAVYFQQKKIFAESPWGDGGAGVMRQVNEAVKTLIGK